jgi:hypothetical protein
VLAQCKIKPSPQDFLFGFFIPPVLCCRQALIKVLSAMPFPMLSEVVAFLFAECKPILQFLY